MLAVGLDAFDPAEACRIALMTGHRERVQDKEAALSFVRNAFGYERMTPADLVTHFPPTLNAVNHLGEPPDIALERIAALLQRHRRSVAKVMRAELATGRRDRFPADSLPNLYGELLRAQVLQVNPDSGASPGIRTLRRHSSANRMEWHHDE